MNSELLSNFWSLVDGGSWGIIDRLNPFAGFAVYNKSNEKIFIGDAVSESEFGRMDKKPNIEWGLKFSILSEDGANMDKYNYIGVSNEAQDGIDISDEMNPPFMGKGVDISFIEDDYQLAISNKNNMNDYNIWKLKLYNETNGPVSLKWSETVYNSSYNAYIYTPDNNTYIDLSDNDNIHFGEIREEIVYVIAGLSDNILSEFGETITDLIPSEISFDSAYPNPFNPTTTISFAIPTDAQVTITVYNIRGSEVVSLVNGNMAAGYHSINWNADSYSSGIYFVKMVAGSYVNTQKLMLVK